MVLKNDQELAVEAARQFAEMKANMPLETDRAKIDYIYCVAQAVVKELPAEYRDLEWEMAIFESDAVNAFAMPGGKIGVMTGILKAAQNQHQLAAVLGTWSHGLLPGITTIDHIADDVHHAHEDVVGHAARVAADPHAVHQVAADDGTGLKSQRVDAAAVVETQHDLVDVVVFDDVVVRRTRCVAPGPPDGNPRVKEIGDFVVGYRVFARMADPHAHRRWTSLPWRTGQS